MAAAPAPFFTSPPVPETTPESRLLPAPSRVRSNPPLVTAPLTVSVPLLLTKDCAAARVVPMAQVLFPVWLTRPHWSVTGLPDRAKPPLVNTTCPTAVSRSLVLLCRRVPWKVSDCPLTGNVPLQFAAVLQLPFAPPPFQMLRPLVVMTSVPLVDRLLVFQSKPNRQRGQGHAGESARVTRVR